MYTVGMEGAGPLIPRERDSILLPEAKLAERVMLAMNAVQCFHAGYMIIAVEQFPKIVAGNGPEFRAWLDSVQGQTAITNYAQQHSYEEIEAFKDIEHLEDMFKHYLTRKPRTLH